METQTIEAISGIVEKIGVIGVLLLVWQQSSRRADLLMQALIEDWRRDKDTAHRMPVLSQATRSERQE